MKKVYLYGRLGERFGKKWNLGVRSPAEAFAAIESNSEGFLSYMLKKEKEGVRYFVFNKNPAKIKNKKELQESVIDDKSIEINFSSEELHIMPQVKGAEPVSTFLAITLIEGTKITIGSILIPIVVAFVVGAIMKSLFKPPQQQSPTTTKSFLMQGSQNRANQGVSVPVGYGTLKIGSTNIGQDKITKPIIKSKGTGGDKSHKVLESFSTIEYTELLSEGPIAGIVSSTGRILDTDLREGIYLNNVPIRNHDPSGQNDGSLNFILNEEGEAGQPKLTLGENGETHDLCEYSPLLTEYGTSFHGPPPYCEPKDDSHLATFDAAIAKNAKILTHYVANPFVTRTRLTFGARVSRQQKSGATVAETVKFAIKIVKDGKEFDINDPASGCVARDYAFNPLRGPTTTTQETDPNSSDNEIDVTTPNVGLTAAGGSFSIHGIATSTYEFDVLVEYDRPKDISKGVTFKIVKLTKELDPSVDGGAIGGIGVVRNIEFVGATDYIMEKVLYPHSAIAKIKFDSKNFSSVPERSYLCKMKKVLVPTNYNPDTREYIGPWDGLFKGQQSLAESIHSIDDENKEWTDNPAWIYYDILSNARFGISKFGLDEGDIDRWQLYRIAKYCDELVETDYPIETKTGLPRCFSCKISSDNSDSNTFSIKLEKSHFENSADRRSEDLTKFRFYEEFGQDKSFQGKKIAFFISTEGGSNDEVRFRNSSFRKGEVIIEERTIVSSNCVENGELFDFIVELSGKPFSEGANGNTVLGACATQISHSIVEPRFTSNVYVTDRMKAIDLINQFASVFRGITAYYNGQIIAIQDSQKLPIALFNDSNVSAEGFSYSGITKDQKVTTSLVRYNNKDNHYRTDVVIEESPEAVNKFGYREEETLGFGITSQSQARRLAKWVIFTTQLEIETINFKSGIESSYLFPGAIFEVSDEARSGQNKSGRILRVQVKDQLPEQNLSEYQRTCLLLDKNTISEPFNGEPEITIAVASPNSEVEKIEKRARFERSSEDQDAEIESIFAPQILRFKCRLGQGYSLAIGREDKIIDPGPQGQTLVAEDLRFKSGFIMNLEKNLFNVFNHGFEDGDIISFETDGVLPRGLSLGAPYTIVSRTKNTFKVTNKLVKSTLVEGAIESLGFYPLFLHESSAENAKNNLGEPVGNGSAEDVIVGNKTYYRPAGLVVGLNRFDGDFVINLSSEGFDSLGNIGGSHFIVTESERINQNALDKISVGSAWSLKGRPSGSGGGEHEGIESQVKAFLEINEELTGAWAYSDFLGLCYFAGQKVKGSDWFYSANLGFWVYAPPVSDNPSQATWLWFSDLQRWVWIKPKGVSPSGQPENFRHWWHIMGEGWLYVYYDEAPERAFLYTENPADKGTKFRIGELLVTCDRKYTSNPKGALFKWPGTPNLIDPQTAKSVHDSSPTEDIIDNAMQSEEFVGINLSKIQIKDEGGRRFVVVHLQTIRNIDLQLSDGEFVWIRPPGGVHDPGQDIPLISGLYNLDGSGNGTERERGKNDYWVVKKINENEFELEDSGLVADFFLANKFDTTIFDFEAYVNAHQDLVDEWNNDMPIGGINYTDKESWGSAHWQVHGEGEGRSPAPLKKLREGTRIMYINSAIKISSDRLEGQLFRTMSVKESEGGMNEITGLEFVSSKFDAIDKKNKVIRPRIPIPPQESMEIPDGPTNLILTDLTL